MKKLMTGLIGLFGILHFSGCSKPPRFQAVRVTNTTVESTISSTSSGTVEADQQAALGFSTTGRIKTVSVKAGARVQQGQILAELENEDLKSVFQENFREFSRNKKLQQAGLVSRAALDNSQKDLKVAEANLNRAVIRAPYDGLVTEVNLEEGELTTGQVTTEKAPIQIVDLKPRIIKAEIDEIDLSKIHINSRARMKVLAIRPTPFLGVVTRVVPFVSTTKEQDRTSAIELKLTETEPLIPVGASAEVEVVTARKENVPALPSRVVLGVTDHRSVFQLKDGKLRKKSVQAGIGNYDRTEILSGLSSGDVVVFPSETVEIEDGMKAQVDIVSWP